jgi:hypothetical protein
MVRVKPDVAVAGLRGRHASPATAARIVADRVSGVFVHVKRSTRCVADLNHESQSARLVDQPRARPLRSCQGTRCAQARSIPEGRAERAVEAERRALTAPRTARG